LREPSKPQNQTKDFLRQRKTRDLFPGKKSGTSPWTRFKKGRGQEGTTPPTPGGSDPRRDLVCKLKKAIYGSISFDWLKEARQARGKLSSLWIKGSGWKGADSELSDRSLNSFSFRMERSSGSSLSKLMQFRTELSVFVIPHNGYTA